MRGILFAGLALLFLGLSSPALADNDWWHDPETRNQILRDAQNGNDVAQFIAGSKLLMDGNEKQGMDFLYRSARQGNADAQAALGLILSNTDVPQAIRWFEKAARQGHADAQSRLGNFYADGEGVAQDLSRAHALWEQAARQGHATAQFKLGALYIGAKDYATARFWLQKAADQNQAEAQFALGLMYERGQGGSVDYDRAMQLYDASCRQGNAMGCQLKEKLTATLYGN